MQSIVILIYQIINIYIWVLIAMVIVSWLIAFNIVNLQNKFVYTVSDVLNRLTEPVLAPIRRYMPNLGGIDISPVVLILGLLFAQNLLLEMAGRTLIR